MEKPKQVSKKYLQECRNAVLAADYTKQDYVIKDLRRRINKITLSLEKQQDFINSIWPIRL